MKKFYAKAIELFLIAIIITNYIIFAADNCFYGLHNDQTNMVDCVVCDYGYIFQEKNCTKG